MGKKREEIIEIKIQAKLKLEDERDGSMYRDSRKFLVRTHRAKVGSLLSELEEKVLERFPDESPKPKTKPAKKD